MWESFFSPFSKDIALFQKWWNIIKRSGQELDATFSVNYAIFQGTEVPKMEKDRTLEIIRSGSLHIKHSKRVMAFTYPLPRCSGSVVKSLEGNEATLALSSIPVMRMTVARTIDG